MNRVKASDESNKTEETNQEAYYGGLNLSNFGLWVNEQKLDESADATQATVKDGDEIELTFNWSITNNVTDSNGEKQLAYAYELNTYGITLNDLYNDDEDSNAIYSNDIRIGYYTIVENVFTIYLDKETTENKSDISGGVVIAGVVSLNTNNTLYDNSEQILGVEDVTYNVIYNSGNPMSTATIKKSAVGDIVETAEGFYTQQYQIVINITGKVTDISVEDVLPNELEYVEDTLTADEGVTAEYKDGAINVTIPDSESDSSSYKYTITYTAQITNSAVLSGNDITNTAKIKYTDSYKAEQEKSSAVTISLPSKTNPTEVGYVTVEKEAVGEIAYHTADSVDTENYYYQDYSIVVDVIGKVTNISLSDELPDQLTLIESSLAVDSGDVTLTYANPTITATFPNGAENEEKAYTITYRAKVDTTVIKELTDIENTATVTYNDPEGEPNVKNSTVTVYPINISLSKEGSYAGFYGTSPYQAFDWVVTIDFGTLGLSLSDDDINEILKTITDTSYYGEDENQTLAPKAAFGGTNSPYLNSSGQSENALKIFFNGGDLTVDDLIKNEDGTYSIYYSASYLLYSYGTWGVDLTSFTNVFGLEVNDIVYTTSATVTSSEGTIEFDKSSSLDSSNSGSKSQYTTFNDQDITTIEEETFVLYNKYEGYYFIDYVIEIITPEDVPISNIIVNCNLDSALNYVMDSITIENGNGNINQIKLDFASTTYFPKSDSECYILYDTSLNDLNTFSIKLYGAASSNYTIVYRAKILEYDSEKSYENLNSVTFDYDLEIPYTLTFDMSDIVNYGTVPKTQFINKTTEIVFSDSLAEGEKTSYFIDWDENESVEINVYDLIGISNNSWYTDSKYDTVREFLRNFTITAGDTTYSLYNGNLYDFFGEYSCTLTISRYEWKLTFTGSTLVKSCLNNWGGILKISYNSIQDLTNNIDEYQIQILNKGGYSITVNGNVKTDEDYVALTTTNIKYFTVGKSNLVSLTLEKNTYNYTNENNIGWLLLYSGIRKLSNSDVIVITDTLPDNVSYVEGEYVAYFSSDLIFSEEYGTIDADYDKDKNTVTFTIDITSNSIPSTTLYIYYKTQIDDEYYETMQNNGGSYDFQNIAEFEKDGIVKQTGSTKTINTTEKTIITKDSSLNIDSTSQITADFTIAVNANSKNYVSGEENITITDTMPSSFVLNEESVKAIDVNSGNEIKIETEYDEKNNKIYFSIPDETYVKITYTVTIDVDILENPFWYKDTTNTVSITNGTYKGEQASATAATESSFIRIWATMNNGEISIYKFWNDDGTEKSLTGATFTLYSIYNNLEKLETEKIGSVTVDEEGNASFTNLQLDRIYKLVETGVPDGYVQADDYYFILKGNDGVTIPESLSEYTINEIESGSTIKIENCKDSSNTTSNPKTGDIITVFVIIEVVAVAILALNIAYNKRINTKKGKHNRIKKK